MFDFDALCPHCEKKFKLSMVGLEALIWERERGSISMISRRMNIMP
jgi:hypothetical protein